MITSNFEIGLRELIAQIVREELGRQPTSAPPDLVTVDDYARRRSISTSTVRAAIREHRLGAIRIGRAVRVRADAEIGRSTANSEARRAAHRQRLIGGR